MTSGADAQKRAAAERAVTEIRDGMVVGLGSGSTANFAIAALGRRVAGGLKIVGIPTSERSAARARELAIPLTDFAAHRRIDVTIDGADQVARQGLALVKGLGGALLREKIVASASARLIIIVDESKLAPRLGPRTRLPVEIIRFGGELVLDRLAAMGLAPLLRLAGDKPFITDNGNYIADCAIADGTDPATLEAHLHRLVGLIETGLFIGLATTAMVGHDTGVEVIER